MSEKTDPKQLANKLETALSLVARDALAAAVAAGSLAGSEGIALSAHLRGIADNEFRDLERLAARIASLGGSPSLKVGPIKSFKDWRAAVRSLVAMQREALEAVVDAIPADADDAEGEATEHLLEHIVSRKRDAIELLERALR